MTGNTIKFPYIISNSAFGANAPLFSISYVVVAGAVYTPYIIYSLSLLKILSIIQYHLIIH